MKTRRTVLALATLTAALFALVPASSTASISGDRPWAILLCRFSDQPAEPHSISYYQQEMTTTGAGTQNLSDYWHDISYGRLSIAGSQVFGWFTVPMTRYRFNGLSRSNRIAACMNASTGVTFSDFYGVIAVSNQTGPGTAVNTTLTAPIDATQTTIHVASSTGFPAVPFPIVVGEDPATSTPGEKMNVTGVSGTTWTVTRVYQDSIPARSEPRGSTVLLPDFPDLGAAGLGPLDWTINGRHVPLGSVDSFAGADITGLAHETGHGFGLDHSRLLSTSTTDYGDCWDIMSAYSCVGTFTTPYGAGGPGLDAIGLDNQGWLDPLRRTEVKPSGCASTTVDLTALSEAATSLGYLEVRVPETLQIATPGGGKTNSDYYTVELRAPTHWDRGLGRDSVLIHLHGRDGYSYLVDEPAHTAPNHAAGTGYADPRGIVIGVDSINTAAHTARVSIAKCPIPTRIVYTGPTSFENYDPEPLSAQLSTADGIPIQGLSVRLALSRVYCDATTDEHGRAACTLPPEEEPAGRRVVSATFSGTTIFGGAATGQTAQLVPDETAIEYTGELAADFGGTAHVAAHAFDPDADGGTGDLPLTIGGEILFQIGTDTCTAFADAHGDAACTIGLSHESGGLTNVTASYLGDPHSPLGSSSTTRQFLIRALPASVTYTGPTSFLQSHLATLSGTLQTTGGTALAGRILELSVGSDSCSAATAADGVASCTVTPNDDLGPTVGQAVFAGDLDYLAATSRQGSLIYAFPKEGAFVIGAAAAATATTVEWWGKSWVAANALPDSGLDPFSGFASQVAAEPPTCGTLWRGVAGTDGNPPTSVPQYMGVIVTSDVADLDGTFSGTAKRIAIVKADAGYTPSLAAVGTGTIEGYAC